jgi:hypothetical protein
MYYKVGPYIVASAILVLSLIKHFKIVPLFYYAKSSNDLGGACSTYEGKRQVHTEFWWGDLTEDDHLENPGVDGRIILKWIFKK